MGGHGHFARLYGLIHALAAIGADACVFTDASFAPRVRAAGGRFFDLYAGGRSVESVDSSLPRPCRNVTFAAVHAEALAAEVAALSPSVIVADSHAVIGIAVANRLDLPFATIRPGHDVHPEHFLEQVRRDPILELDPRCEAAVETLRDRYGIADASPFSYGTALSPLLNIACEPEAFVSAETRSAIEPVVFFGSLRPREEPDPASVHAGARPLHVYVSFGTVAWFYWAPQALEALETISAVLAARTGTCATLSLGGTSLPGTALARLRRPGVAVERFVDQWRLLEATDVFVTHHGLNSTHEAIYRRVPMLSRPFHADQPQLAEKAQGFGLARPLGQGLGPPLEPAQVHAALDSVEQDRPRMLAALEQVREWEIETFEARPGIARRIVALA
jgi:UDP:flavonoid glycosyltransferase YjiC (YdhE family)